MARDCRYDFKDEKQLGLIASVALTPFDLGVTQSFKLYSTPSEIPGIDQVKIELQRKSGQPADWVRLNKVFMNDLRKQFLIWRSIPAEAVENYRARTLEALENELGTKSGNLEEPTASLTR